MESSDPNRRATLKDIAKRLNLSYQAVAAALAEDGESKITSRVSAKTAERVRKVADEMNYRKSQGARLLRGGPPSMIGLIMDSQSALSFVEIKMLSILGMEQVLSEEGYKLTILQEDLSKLKDGAVPSYISNYNHEAFVIFSFEEGRDKSLLSMMKKYRIPVLDYNGRQDSYNVMATDDIQGSLLVTEHLLSLGHQRMMFVGMNRRHHSSVRRYEAFADIMNEEGQHASVCWLEDAGDLTPRERRRTDPGGLMAKHLLEAIRKHRPTALICKNDNIAWAANQIVQANGWKVPADLSITGFNDLPGTNHCIPPLTTVRYDFEKMGRQGAKAILELIKSPTRRRRFPPLQPELVVRESACPPKG